MLHFQRDRREALPNTWPTDTLTVINGEARTMAMTHDISAACVQVSIFAPRQGRHRPMGTRIQIGVQTTGLPYHEDLIAARTLEIEAACFVCRQRLQIAQWRPLPGFGLPRHHAA